jgi:hypothetical protein
MNRLFMLTAAAAVLAGGSTAAGADGGYSVHRSANPVGQSGHAVRLGTSGDTTLGSFAGRRTVVSDGQGNAAASTASGFATAAGGQGARFGQMSRTADGGLNASAQGSVTTANGGSAERSGSYNRSADGSSASRERGTTVTNANTGVTYDGSTTYTKGSGISRSGSCKDASGQVVACGSAR